MGPILCSIIIASLQAQNSRPEDLIRDFDEIARPEALSENIFTNPLVFAGIVAAVLVMAGLLFKWHVRRSAMAAAEAEEAKRTTKMSSRNKASLKFGGPTSSGASSKAPPKTTADVKITEKTRQEITGIISKVKSLDQFKDDVLSDKDTAKKAADDRAKLEQSGVVDALAQMLVTEVQTEEAKEGRYSKMLVDGLLIFEDEEVQTDPGTAGRKTISPNPPPPPQKKK